MSGERNISEMSRRMRKKALDMAYHAGKNGAHLGGGFSSIEILATLYGAVARVDSKNPEWEDRDKILISKAHCVLAYYTALYEVGFLTEGDLEDFEKNGSDFVGHPIKNISKGIEYAGGSLGMALSVAAGMALHAKRSESRRRVFVLVGDGECEEGSIWEAMLFASNYKLNNLVMIVDNNHLQYDGTIEEIGGLTDIARKIEAFGWEVRQVDGHDVDQLENVLSRMGEDRPVAVVADTVKGKGVSFMENDPLWHHSELKEELYNAAVKEVLGDDL